MSNIIIIDDDIKICEALKTAVQQMNHTADYATSLETGLHKLKTKEYDIVFLDINLPDGTGLDILSDIRAIEPFPDVIIITGDGSMDNAEIAIKSGAWDYIEKGSSLEEIRLSLMRVLKFREQKSRVTIPQKEVIRDGIIGNSSAIKKCLDQLATYSDSESNVIITGETGTGKELFARALHQNSKRSEKDFIVLDCAALPGTLIESILFGHEKGAFTGADYAKSGIIQFANGGTLFLDEIGELPLSIQKQFLRVLQEKRFRPIGGKEEIKSDFRLVAATHRDLEKMVEEKTFREDLLFRIKTLSIQLPPLRNRKEDFGEMVHFLSDKICHTSGIEKKSFSDDFIDSMAVYDWPGNVRELSNTLERIISNSLHEPVLYASHLPENLRILAVKKKVKIDQRNVEAETETAHSTGKPQKMNDFINDMKFNYLKNLMTYTDWKIEKACEVSGLSRSQLYKLLRSHNLSKNC